MAAPGLRPASAAEAPLRWAGPPLNNARLHNTILKNVNRSRERAGRAGPGQRHSSPACCEEDDMSDTTSEKGELHYMANE